MVLLSTLFKFHSYRIYLGTIGTGWTQIPTALNYGIYCTLLGFNNLGTLEHKDYWLRKVLNLAWPTGVTHQKLFSNWVPALHKVMWRLTENNRAHDTRPPHSCLQKTQPMLKSFLNPLFNRFSTSSYQTQNVIPNKWDIYTNTVRQT